VGTCYWRHNILHRYPTHTRVSSTHRFTTLELAALKALQQRARNRQEEQLLAARAQAQQHQQGAGGGGQQQPGYDKLEEEEQRKSEMLEQLRRIAVDLGAASNKRQELRDQVGGEVVQEGGQGRAAGGGRGYVLCRVGCAKAEVA
jgi:hypothetical protein